MKVPIEVEVPAGMIVYDVGTETIRCGRCGETAAIAFRGKPDITVGIFSFLSQHISSCITKPVSSHPLSPGITYCGRRDDVWLCANKSGGSDIECDQGLPK